MPGIETLHQYADLANERGWRLETQRNGHVRWFSPDPKVPVVITGPLGDRKRAVDVRNDIARLKRAGLQLEEKHPVVKTPPPPKPANAAIPVDDETVAIPMAVPFNAKSVVEGGRLFPDAHEGLVKTQERIEMVALVQEGVRAAVGTAPEVVELQRAVAQLSKELDLVADSVARLRTSYQDSIAPLRRDVKSAAEVLAALHEQVTGHDTAISQAVRSVDILAGRLEGEAESRAKELRELDDAVTSLVTDLEKRLIDRIEEAGARVDPLAALKKRLGED